MAIELAQAQQKVLILRQERAEMVAQREQAEAEIRERAQRCADAAEKHREGLEQSQRELQQVRHELEQSRGELEHSHRDAEKARCSATEQKEKFNHVVAELATCRETVATEQASLQQQITALQLERNGLQGQVALDGGAIAHIAAEASETVTDARTHAGNLGPTAHQAPFIMNEGVPQQPVELLSDLQRQLAAMRVQFAFRISRLRRGLDDAVAGACFILDIFP